jgi:hypothetical protein
MLSGTPPTMSWTSQRAVSLEKNGAHFVTIHWSVVLEAGQSSSPWAEEASTLSGGRL